jgi:hypothetical protein
VSLIKDLKDAPTNLATSSRFTTLNGVIYLGAGTLLMIWPVSSRVYC